MGRRFFDLTFTPAVQAQQTLHGSRRVYAAAARQVDDGTAETVSEQDIAFIAARDSFYVATTSETGWPYVQHRGGPVGFVRSLSKTTIGWADYAGNRQYISVGNATADDRVALLFMDYPNRRRLKALGRMQVYDAAGRPDLARQLAVNDYKARVEQLIVVTLEAVDWNCPQHITPRFTLAELEPLLAPLRARIAELERQLAAGQGS